MKEFLSVYHDAIFFCIGGPCFFLWLSYLLPIIEVKKHYSWEYAISKKHMMLHPIFALFSFVSKKIRKNKKL